MPVSRHEGPSRAIRPLTETGFGLLLGFSLALAVPSRTVAGDTLGGADPLPPPQSYLAAYVADSATGLPLTGATVHARNPQAFFSTALTDAKGWAYIARSDLPSPEYGIPGSGYWVTAGAPGYVSRLITTSVNACDGSMPCVLRYALARATEKNSRGFTGTLLDSATHKPIAGFPLDLSHGWQDGWMTYVSRTDDSGRFAYAGIPAGVSTGYFWIYVPREMDAWIMVNMRRSGDTVLVPRWSATTSLAAPRTRLRAPARGKPDPLVLFPSRNRDAAGRRRD